MTAVSLIIHYCVIMSVNDFREVSFYVQNIRTGRANPATLVVVHILQINEKK